MLRLDLDLIIRIIWFIWLYTQFPGVDLDLGLPEPAKNIFDPDVEMPDDWMAGKLSRACDKEAHLKSGVCGDVASFCRVFDNIRSPEFREIPVKDYSRQGCLGRTRQKLNWSSADRACRLMQGELVNLFNIPLASYVKQQHKYVQKERLWTGGRRLGKKQPFKWSPGSNITEIAGNKYWKSDNAPDKNESCVMVNPIGLYGENCNEEFFGLCYLENVRYEVYKCVVSSPGTRDYFNVGDKIFIECRSYNNHSVTTELSLLTEETPNTTVFKWDAEGNIQAKTDSVKNFSYIYSTSFRFYGVRCLKVSIIRVGIVATLELNEYRNLLGVRANPVDNSVYEWKGVIDIVKQEPLKPAVTVKPAKLSIGFSATYTCRAMPAKGSSATVVILGPKTRWAIMFAMNGTEIAVGDKPPWITHIKWKRGYSIWWGGNHFNITVVLSVTSALDNLEFSCYSTGKMFDLVRQCPICPDLLDKRQSGIPKSYYNTKSPTVHYHPRNFITKIELRSPYPKDGKSTPTVFGCDQAHIKCVGWPGVEDRVLTFEIDLADGTKASFNSEGSSQRLKASMAFTLEELNDGKNGPMMIITFTPIGGWQEKTISEYKKFVCRFDEGSDYVEEWETKLNITPGVIPPNFTAEFSEDKTRMQGTCFSYVGYDDTMSYELYNSVGDRFLWFVDKSGNIRGRIFFPWLEIRFVHATFDTSCGQIIETRVNLTVPPRIKGLTLICYSINVEATFTSIYSKEELSASIDIKEGGDITKRHKETTGDKGGTNKGKKPTKKTSPAAYVMIGLLVSLFLFLCSRRYTSSGNGQANKAPTPEGGEGPYSYGDGQESWATPESYHSDYPDQPEYSGGYSGGYSSGKEQTSNY